MGRKKSKEDVEKRLRNSEQKLKSIIEHSRDLFYIHDTKHVLKYVSPQSMEIFGYTPEEMMVKWTTLATKNPINKAGFEATEKAIKTGKKQPVYILEVRRKDGKKRLVEIDESPLKNDKGNVIGISGILRAVTEQKKIKGLIERSEKQFRMLIDSSPDIIFLKDKDFRYLIINKANADFFGKKFKEIIGKTDFDLMPRESALECRKSDSAALKQRKVIVGEEKVGDTVYETRKVPVIVDNKCVGVAGVIHDITNRKIASYEVEESEKRLKDITYSIADWIWEVNEKGQYTYCSEKVKDILRYSPKEILGKTPFDLMPKEEAKEIREIFSKLIKNKEPIKDLENWNLRKDGNLICLLTNAVPIIDENGSLKGYRGVDKDITDRKKSEEEIKKRTKELEKFNKIAVGRELKMVELKKKVKELESKLRESKIQ